MKTQIIEVKKSHIKNGTPKQGNCCPVALALRDRGFDDVHVDGEHIDIDYSAIPCPRSVTRFVKKFDKGGKVKPFRFKLKIEE